jgi:uroporphyrinogen-III decarboxylase
METYTGRKRVSAAFKTTFTDQEIKVDRVPAYPIMGQCNAQLVGASIRDFIVDPKVFVKAQVAAYERYKPDIMVMQGDLLMDVEAMGNELRFPENGMCISKKKFQIPQRMVACPPIWRSWQRPKKSLQIPSYPQLLLGHGRQLWA